MQHSPHALTAKVSMHNIPELSCKIHNVGYPTMF